MTKPSARQKNPALRQIEKGPLAMVYVVFAAVGWFCWSPLTYAIVFADSQRSFPELAKEEYREDIGDALLFSLLGPIGLLVAFFTSGFARHGLKWR